GSGSAGAVWPRIASPAGAPRWTQPEAPALASARRAARVSPPPATPPRPPRAAGSVDVFGDPARDHRRMAAHHGRGLECVQSAAATEIAAHGPAAQESMRT